MVLETAQLLCTAYHVLQSPLIPHIQSVAGKFYKQTHTNHPCAIWTRESAENFAWVVELGLGLCDEYYNRFGLSKNKRHATEPLIAAIAAHPLELPSLGLTPFTQAMPEEYRDTDAVIAYRNYYRDAKSAFAAWRYGHPTWW